MSTLTPEVEARFERIQALLHAMAERGSQMEARFDRRMEAAEKRMEAAEKRMDRYDAKLESTRELIEAGIRLTVRRDERHSAQMAELRRSIADDTKALKSLGRNGNGRKG